MPSQLSAISAVEPQPAVADLDVRGFSYEARSAILPALAEALASSGCWLHDRKALSLAQMEYRFEMPLRSAVDLYSGLRAGADPRQPHGTDRVVHAAAS
jgi:hypothetical protein